MSLPFIDRDLLHVYKNALLSGVCCIPFQTDLMFLENNNRDPCGGQYTCF